MRILDRKHLVSFIVTITCVIGAFCLFTLSGCTILGFLASAGPFEKKTVPVYDLKAQQDRKVMIWVECPVSSGADYDLSKKLATAFQLTLIEKGKLKAENIILPPERESGNVLVDVQEVARSQGAGYALLVHVDTYSIDSLRVRDYYSGELVIRTVLQDTDLGSRVWPQQPEGKMIHMAVEIGTEGRDALVSRLASGAAHCTLRYLYPCDKLKFKHSDEKVSIQEAFEMETY